MKILLVTGPDISLKEPYASGIEAFIVSLGNQLVRNGHTVDVIAQNAESDVMFNIIDLGKRNFKRRSFKSQITRFARLHKNTYDVIHYNLFIPELYEVAAQSKIPSLLTLHSPADDVRSQTYRKLVAQKDITFVSISERIKQQWDESLHLETTLIHNGIDVSKWQINRGEGKYLLWTARINEQKNVAAAIALAKHLKQPLKIAGRIVDQHYFNTQVKPHLSTTIEYIGHTTQQQLRELARDATAFLATAKWQEPFGLNTLEMLACGLPVVGFESAIPPDLRKDNISIAVPSNDWRALIRPLESVSHTRSELCVQFAQTMDIHTMAKSYGSLYQLLKAQTLNSIPTTMSDELSLNLPLRIAR